MQEQSQVNTHHEQVIYAGKWENGENGDSALFFLLKIGRCPHFPNSKFAIAFIVITHINPLHK